MFMIFCSAAPLSEDSIDTPVHSNRVTTDHVDALLPPDRWLERLLAPTLGQ